MTMSILTHHKLTKNFLRDADGPHLLRHSQRKDHLVWNKPHLHASQQHARQIHVCIHCTCMANRVIIIIKLP